MKKVEPISEKKIVICISFYFAKVCHSCQFVHSKVCHHDKALFKKCIKKDYECYSKREKSFAWKNFTFFPLFFARQQFFYFLFPFKAFFDPSTKNINDDFLKREENKRFLLSYPYLLYTLYRIYRTDLFL